MNIRGSFKIAVDWVTNNIYLVQKSLSRIDVFSPDGVNRTSLITTGLFAPTALALDPNESLLFFTDAGNPRNKRQPPKIERLFMDGSGRQQIVRDKLLEPIALAVDIVKKRLFWVDRKYDHLETSDYHGTKRFIIASGSQNLPHTLSLDVFESTIFYADTTRLAILKLLRHTVTTDANITYHVKLGNDMMPTFVKAYHETKQSKLRTNPCAVNNSRCEHFCLLSHGSDALMTNSFRCKCQVGYQLKRDLKSCEKVTEFAFVSQGNSIRAISIEPNVDVESRVPIIMPRIGLSRIIDIDSRGNLTFFFDPIRRAVFQAKFKDQTSVDVTPLVPDDLNTADGLAYDWIGKNLYISTLNKIVVVRQQTPNVRRDLIRQNMVLALAVDPNRGYLFYSSIARPAKIHRAFLDGSNTSVLYQGGISVPSSISLDYTNRKIYWADSQLNKIQFIDYNGSNMMTLFSSAVYQPLSIFVHKYYVYFIDGYLSNINRVTKYNARTPIVIRSGVNFATQLKIYSTEWQSSVDNHPCARQNGDCSHFCFAVPSADQQYQISRHCGCPFGYKLDTLMINCIPNPDETVASRCNAPYYFKCANNRCIKY